MRVWGGRPTLATEQGKELKTFDAFEAWLAKQPDGQLEVWAGRWWLVSRESRPFMVEHGKTFCDHPGYRGNMGADPHDFPGFFAFEAWKRAGRVSGFYAGIDTMAGEALTAARGGDEKT
ncbi:hypothetical protein CXK99_20705 [Stutzerimonas stutzeri]|uniref:Uncharacterized protein n=2 Tax=Stutzerimonas stutzeri TaxID=316 RepID=A0A2N8R948_STUST|nr:hypothetical protein CXK99_20705 [Stutzerimonas stutzeri]